MHYFASSSQRQHQQHWEDVILDGSCSESNFRPFNAWAVFDGHNGDRVARHLGRTFLPELERRLPATALPEDSEQEKYVYADHVRRAVLATFLQLSLEVQQKSLGAGCGSTATVVVQTDELLTVANVGSTRCVLDVGHTSFECTDDHKLGSNEAEEERLDAVGACIGRLKFDLSGPAGLGEAGCGPLRLWPGGLTMSRAIGDSDCSRLVIPHPYIQQVWLPRSKASRVIIATGNVWDSFDTYQRAASALRDVSLHNAADAMLQRALKRKQHRIDKGDMTVMVVDFVPEHCLAFSSQHRLERLSRSSTCSSSSSQGINLPSPGSLFRKSASAARLPNLPIGSVQQQQHKVSRSLTASGAASAATVATASIPLCSSSSSSSSMARQADTSHAHQQQQQQEGVGARGLLQRLLPQLCRGACTQNVRSGSSSSSSSGGGVQLRAAARFTPMLQSISSFGSSCESDGTINSSSASSGVTNSTYSPRSSTTTRSSSSGVLGSWRTRSSWRSRTISRKAAAQQSAAVQQQQHTDYSFARIIAKIDTFQVYFKGQYLPVEQQLQLLDMTCNWPTVRAGRGFNSNKAAGDCDLAAKGCDANTSAKLKTAISCH